MSDHDLLTFAPEFWNETFVHHYRSDEDCEMLHTDEWIVWQPVRPLLSEITHKQLKLFEDEE